MFAKLLLAGLLLFATPALAMQKHLGYATDTSGNVVTTASVRVKIHDSVSDATIYEDNGVTPKLNPFDVESDGSYTFYAANGAYDVVVTASDYTFDADDTSDIRLFDQRDTLTAVVSVKDYGAKGDGVTDDTAAIQAAFDSLNTRSGSLYFPPGIYYISSTLTHTGTAAYGWTFFSDHSDFGGNATRIVWNGVDGGTMLKITGGVGFRIAHLYFDGSRPGHRALYAIQLDSTSGSGGVGLHDGVVDKVSVTMGDYAASAAIALGHTTGGTTDQVSEIVFRDVVLFGSNTNVGTGILTLEGGNTKNFKIEGGTIAYFATGVDWSLQSVSAANAIHTTTFLANGTRDISLGADTVSIIGVRSETSAQFVSQAASNNPHGLTIQDSYWAGTTDANDTIIHASGFLYLMNNYFINSRTGASIPRVKLASPLNGTGNAFGGLFSAGNMFTNTANSTGNAPFQDESGNDLFVTGGYYETNSLALNAVSLGDRGGTIGSVVQFPNYWPVGGTYLASQYKGVPTLFANLGTPVNGTTVYCSDCTYNSNPCTGASTGAIAKRINGAWRCD